jgi:staphylococcal nuclease domain-containing protein 1
MAFGHVELVPEQAGEEKVAVNEMVVARGFATVIRHRSDEVGALALALPWYAYG